MTHNVEVADACYRARVRLEARRALMLHMQHDLGFGHGDKWLGHQAVLHQELCQHLLRAAALMEALYRDDMTAERVAER